MNVNRKWPLLSRSHRLPPLTCGSINIYAYRGFKMVPAVGNDPTSLALQASANPFQLRRGKNWRVR